MMKSENEILLKQNSDFNGLLDLYLSRKDSLGSLKITICKVYYYSGRLKTKDKLYPFIKKNEDWIFMYVNKEYKELAKFLFNVGYEFPYLTKSNIETLEKYYTSPEYYDLLEDILFDQNLLNHKLRKFDASVRLVKNVNFTDELLNDIFNAGLYNFDIINDEVYYYNKSNNKVEKKIYNDGVIFKVHYTIDLIRTFRQFANAIDEVLGSVVRKAFFSMHSKEFQKNYTYERILETGFHPYYFDLFKSFINENSTKFNLPQNPIEKLILHISLEWVNEINNS